MFDPIMFLSALTPLDPMPGEPVVGEELPPEGKVPTGEEPPGAGKEQDDTPKDPPPVEDTPPETEEPPAAEVPVEQTPPAQEDAVSEEEEEVTTSTGEPEPVPEPLPLWMGVSAGALAGLILGILGTLLVRKLFCRKQKPIIYPKTEELSPLSAPAASGVQVSKLHQQGARSSQQDSFAVSPENLYPAKGLLAVVCDGMGGLKNGDKVSQAAVAAIVNGFLELDGAPDRLLLCLLAKANRAVNDLLGPGGQRSSGTTVVAGILKENHFSFLSVGDSRICLFRDGQLFQLNREHVFINELSTDAVNDRMSFREAWSDSRHGALTSFVGMGELKHIDIPARPQEVRPGDKLILMSDGVYNALTEEELKSALILPSGADTDLLGQLIEDKHFEHQDNYTAVVLSIS